MNTNPKIKGIALNEVLCYQLFSHAKDQEFVTFGDILNTLEHDRGGQYTYKQRERIIKEQVSLLFESLMNLGIYISIAEIDFVEPQIHVSVNHPSLDYILNN